MVVWKEEVYSGLCGVLIEAVAGDTSRHARGPCCVLVVCR